MAKKILLTGATDGIGLETAKMLVGEGHTLLLHGRNAEKLENIVSTLQGSGAVESYVCDLSDLDAVRSMAAEIRDRHDHLDVLINNAGVYKTPNPITDDGLDIRFVVNTIAPYLLTKSLLPIMSEQGRIINLSSAAQSPVNLNALNGEMPLDDGAAYAQSKLAITMWSNDMALSLSKGPLIVAVNPGSLLGSKMVNEAFGIDGGDIRIGADILVRAALSDEFIGRTGEYFDNDAGKFGLPHRDALDRDKSGQVVNAIEAIIA